MAEFQKEFLSLIKSAVMGEKAQVSADFDFERAYNIAKSHEIVPIIYYALIDNERFNKSPISKRFFSDTCLMIKRSENQRIENEKIFRAFCENNIEYMPFKGAVIKDIYPYPEMRVMGDSDILIKAEKMKKASKIMKKLGFKFYSDGECERCFKKDNYIIVEIHKMLFSKRQKDLYSCFGDGWQNAIKSQRECMYELSHNDNYIYLFLHFTNHYRVCGIGIRHIIDLFMYKKAYPLDMDYISEKIKGLNLGEFYENICEVLDVWFCGKAPSEKTDFITNFIFSCGSYGNLQNHALSETVREFAENENHAKKIKKDNVFTVLFPRYKKMKILYPVLEKAPILLPFTWIARIFDRVFKKDKAKSKLAEIKEINKVMTEENVENYRKSLLYVGLNFDFNIE